MALRLVFDIIIQNISLVSISAGSPFFDIIGAASVPYKNSFLMVGGYSYEVDGDYIDLVHYYNPESGSITPLEGRLQNKKGVNLVRYSDYVNEFF